MSKKIIVSCFILFSLFFTSCAGGLTKAKFLSGYDTFRLDSIEIVPVNEKELHEQINRTAERVRTFSGSSSSAGYDDLVKHLERTTAHYKSYIDTEKIADFKEGVYTIPAKTRVKVNVRTYCLDVYKASPKENEPYILVNGSPDIVLYKEIMKHTNVTEDVSHTLKQILLWHLNNKVKFERLHPDEQALLLRIDSNAYFLLDNYLKDFGKKMLASLIPGFKEAESLTRLVRGTAHTYKDYASNIENIVSKVTMPVVKGPIQSRGYEDIYTMTEHNGFNRADITFINISSVPQTISLNSYFKPLRNDVQPLGFNLPKINKSKPISSVKDPEFYTKIKKAMNELARLYRLKRNIFAGEKELSEFYNSF